MTFASQLASTFTPIAAVYDAPSVTQALSLAQSAVVNYCNQTFDVVLGDTVFLDPQPRHTALLPQVPVLNVSAVSALLPPQTNAIITTLQGTPSSTGGTFAAGQYFWVITAIMPIGEMTKSNEVTAVFTGSTSSMSLTWTAVQGATGYSVYRGALSSTENIRVTTLGAVTSYTDTGIAGVGGVPPSGLVWTTLVNYRFVSDTGLIYDTTGQPSAIVAPSSPYRVGPTWPWMPGGLQVTYDHGYSTVPQDVVNVAVGLAQQYLENPVWQLQRRVGDIEDRFAGSIGVVIPDMARRILDRYTDIGIG